MLFSQAQVLELTGMSVERLRHWRRGMPELDAHSGRRPSFTFEELAALAVMSRMADEFGVGAAVLAPHAAAIFAIFADDDEVGDPGVALCLSASGVRLMRLPLAMDDDVTLVARTDVVMSELMVKLRDGTGHGHPQLALPL